MAVTESTESGASVTNKVFPVPEIPKFKRGGFTRSSEIEETLKAVKDEYGPDTPVCIRQYEKKESASGTLYNLRSRHGQPAKDEDGEFVDRPAEDGTPWDGWVFKIGPLDDFDGGEGQTGLFAMWTAP